MTRIILLNGPRTVGKDYIADSFIERVKSARKLPVAFFIKRQALEANDIEPYFAGYLEGYKDRPIGGVLQDVPEPVASKTPRELYIEHGEYMRSEEGDDYFAKLWAVSADMFRGYGHLLVPDVRFQPEVDEAAAMFGPHNVLLVRVHREDYGWANDIGSYLKHPYSVDFHNDDTTSCAGDRLVECIRARML